MKYKLLFFLVLVSFLVFACSQSGQQQEDPIADDQEFEVYIEEPNDLRGVFLLDGSISELRDDGRMHWRANINAGDTVGWTGELREAIRAYDGQTRNFYRVELNGEFWVHDWFIYGPAIPALIINPETVLYNRPEPAAVARTGTVTLPRYTLVAMVPGETVDDFVQIAVHQGGTRMLDRYVRLRDISWDTNDVDSVKLTRIAAATQNPASRRELLNNAMELAQRGRNLLDVPAGLDYHPVFFELELTNNLEQLDGHLEYIITVQTAEVREMPSQNSPVRERLSQGELFWVQYRTKNEVTLEAANEETEALRGIWLGTIEGFWVFGAHAAYYR